MKELEEIRSEIDYLKNVLKYYHGEPIRKVEIDDRIGSIEELLNKIENSLVIK